MNVLSGLMQDLNYFCVFNILDFSLSNDLMSLHYRYKYRWCHQDRLLSASRSPLRAWCQPKQCVPHYFHNGRAAHSRGVPANCDPGERSLSRAGEVLHLHHRDWGWCGLPVAGTHGSGQLWYDEAHPRGSQRQQNAQRVRMCFVLSVAINPFYYTMLEYFFTDQWVIMVEFCLLAYFPHLYNQSYRIVSTWYSSCSNKRTKHNVVLSQCLHDLYSRFSHIIAPRYSMMVIKTKDIMKAVFWYSNLVLNRSKWKNVLQGQPLKKAS